MLKRQKRWISIFTIVALLITLWPMTLPITVSADASCGIVAVDGVKDSYWNSFTTLGTSETKGHNDFQINNLKITNDSTYLYYWIDGTKLANWGTEKGGLFLDLALAVNDGNVGDSKAAPWGGQYNFEGTTIAPTFHVLHRIIGEDQIDGAAIYAGADFNTPLAASWDDLKGSSFAAKVSTGFEGKIPLALLGLSEYDSVSAIAVLSGNTATEHGAFDVIPEDPANHIAASWNESATPNVQSTYSNEHTIAFGQTPIAICSSTPSNNAIDVSIDLEEVSIKFNQDITILDDSLPSIAGIKTNVTASTPTDTITFELVDSLAYNTSYTATIPVGTIEGVTTAQNVTFRTEQDPTTLNTYNIHYFRYDGKQLDWDMWLWGDGYPPTAVPFTGVDANGFATATVSAYDNQLKVITRPGNWDSQEVERLLKMTTGQRSVDLWMIQGDPTVYTRSEDADVSARVKVAFADSLTKINVTTTHEVAANQVANFSLYNVTDDVVVPTTATKLSATSYQLTTAANSVDVKDEYEVHHTALSSSKVTMRKILDDNKFFYNGTDLGLTYGTTDLTFKVWAPTATKVSLALYNNEGDYNAEGDVIDQTNSNQQLLMTEGSNGLWSINQPNTIAAKYYMYKVEFADGTVNYAVDPYAKAVSANGGRTAILNLDSTNPSNWNNDTKPPMINPTDAILYELHVRDFSIADDSGVSDENKGKYAAFTEDGLVDQAGNKLGVDHLAELGITHLHLMPAYDFKTVNELTVDDPDSTDSKFNWGYDPQNYNVPEGSYATDVTDPSIRITEFKQMVQALHDKGIRVVMDVVYNHTYDIDNGPFDNVVPGYYYRTNIDGTFSNGSGVGNEIATERPMVRKFIKDSVRYWAEEYNVDGFRFDLMGIIDTTTMAEITEELHNEVDPTLLVYGEPWMGGSTPLAGSDQTLKGSQKDLNFAVFNDNFRSAIKGDSDGDSKGFATGELSSITGIMNGINGAINDFTNSPSETINYVTAHDNLNLWDKVARTQGLFSEMNMINIVNGVLAGGGNIDDAVAAAKPYIKVNEADVLSDETVKRSLLANGIVLTSQGIPFIHAGDELLRSKYGDHNSYRSPDSVNQINWSNKDRFTEVNDYYSGLIALRKAHPAFRMTTKADINNNLKVLQSKDGVVAYQLKNNANYDEWKNIIVIYNGNKTDAAVNLPVAVNGWNVVVDNKQAGTTVIDTVTTSQVVVAGLSMMVLYDEASSYTSVATSINVTLPKVAIEVGKQIIATAQVKDQNGRTMSGQTVDWLSSNAAVATIDATGKIIANANGVTTITAKLSTVEKAVTLNVATLVPTSIKLSGGTFVYTDYSTKLSAVVKDQFNQVMTNQPIQWTTSNDLIAIVDGTGIVNGIAPGNVTITATIGSVSTTHSLEVKAYERRYIQFEYTRPDKDYTDWSLWLWNTGVVNDQIEFTVVNDVAIAKVEIAPNVTQVGFIVKKGAWVEKDPDMDRFVNVQLDETFVKVQLTSGQAAITQTAKVSGPVINGDDVTFYYRNDELYRQNTHHTIQGVKLNFAGQVYTMQYDAAGEFYYYTVEDITEGEYVYTFDVMINNVTTTISDPKNTVDGISKIKYEVVHVSAQASVSPASFNYAQHAILKVETATSIEQINGIYADLTALGGTSRVPVDKILKELSLSVVDSIQAGTKNIPITILDINNVEHKFTTTVKVVARTNVGSKDFDWDEARIYFMLTDRFNDGDSSNNDPNGENYDTSHLETYHGGDFQGVIDKLDYLEDLGINTIWVTPIVDNIDWNLGFGQPWLQQYGYHGYWAKDFTAIDEHLGDLDTFKELIEKAHDRGMKIMVDVVLNHTGYGMDSTKEPIATSNYPTANEQAVFDGLIRTSPIEGDEILGELAFLPDLRTEDEAVRNQIIQWQVDWLDKARTDRGDSIDFYRVDTVKHVDSTTVSQFKNELTKVDNEFKLIGEVFGASVDDQRGYLGSGQMDSLLDFGFNDIADRFIDGQIDAVETALQARNAKLSNTATLGQFLSSHDEDGFLIAHADNDEGKMKVAAALQITSKGQPVIYYGEELGMSGLNADFDANRFGENRYDMPWDELEERSDMLTHYQKLLNAREQYSKVFSKGDRTKVAGGDSDQYVVFKRSYKGNAVYVGLNTTNVEKELSFTVTAAVGTKLTELYSGVKYTVSKDHKVTLPLPARSAGGTILLAENAPTNSTGNNNNNGVESTKVIVNSDHVVNGQYVVSLPADATEVEFDLALANLPLVITSGDATILLSAEQLQELQKQGLTSITITVKKVDNAQDTTINNYGEQHHVNLERQSATISFSVKGKNTQGNAVPVDHFVQGVNLSFKAPKQSAEQWLGIYRINEDGSLSYVPTSLVNGQYVATVHTSGDYVLLNYNKQFNDVPTSFWAYDLIKRAAAMQIILGTTEDTFSPKGNITRAEFTTILTRVLNLEDGSASPFSDVGSDRWYSKSINAAYAAGLVNGRSDTQFVPNGTITREEMATLIVRAFEFKLGHELEDGTATTFADEASIAQWAIEAIEKATAAGIIEGKGHNNFDPKGLLTRAEAVKVLLLLDEQQ
ncbi:type I pullulanase [Paenibacillus endoradicis]|uniref:type I pullulanase n=1 Tax=Paenibacillus endoradicis TaxID=2972487 RepID=UPI002158D3C9|nr:type I pullulanase [Paenibacillus endoradicis]MCR8657151.1 type I pullulanase [Paenibacillus endoradicis]